MNKTRLPPNTASQTRSHFGKEKFNTTIDRVIIKKIKTMGKKGLRVIWYSVKKKDRAKVKEVNSR